MTKKVIETVNGWYMENPKQKVELDDIIGLVKTDEHTDSVQLKKEAQLSICEKRMIELEKENEQLKQALKNSYINEICENCKYGNYFKTDNFIGGFEWDFECTKKHFGKEHWKCDGLTECDDFELKIGR